jgi:4'-phosphopantetheinyl transferase EntD
VIPTDSLRCPRSAALIASLLPSAVAVCESTGRPPAGAPGPFPAEEAALRTAGPRRRAEFAAGRSCARTALARLRVTAGPILPGPAGEPRWPAGVTGSITHCAGYQAAAVARTGDVAAIGIDAEPDAGLPAGLIEKIANGAERAWISRQAAAPPVAAAPAVCWDRLLFSAKEAAGKLWYPLTGRWPGYHDTVIGLTTTGTFTVRMPGPGPVTGDGPPTSMTGRWLAAGGLIITAIAWAPRRARRPS